MTKKLEKILDELMDSSQSESIAVAECLQSIASNGDGSETDAHLLGCAEEIRDAAQSIMDRMKPRKRKTEQAKLTQLAQRIIKDYAKDFETEEPIVGSDAVDSLGEYVELAQAALGLPITTATRNETF